MNIAILIPSLGGGGAERVAQRIGDYYISKEENVFYFLGDFNIKQAYAIKGKIINTKIKPIDLSNNYGMMFTIYNIFRNALFLRKLKKKYHIDVSISFMEDFNYLNVISRADDRVIVRVCTVLSERSDLSGLLYQRKWIKRIYSRADKVVVMSNFGFHEMRDIYEIPEKKLAIIPNPISLPAVQYDEEVNWNYGTCPVIFVGRLDPVKQPDRILRAFRFVAERNSEARLLMVGKGRLVGYLKSLCRRYNLENRVVFTGFKKDTTYLLKKAKVFVMASKVEGFPNAMIEAMSFGVPVVAVNSPGGIADILKDGEYGILTPPMPKEKIDINAPLTDGEIAMGKAILSVLEDKALYGELQKKSLMRSKDFETNKIMKLWNEIIED